MNAKQDAIEFGRKCGQSMFVKYFGASDSEIKAEAARIHIEATTQMSAFYGRRWDDKVGAAVLKGMRQGWQSASTQKQYNPL